MKIKIERSKLLPALSLITSVVERQQTLPILANLYFSLEGGVLTIIGTDSSVEITQTLSGVEGENCSFTISAKKISDICRMLPDKAEIQFAWDKDQVVVTSGRSRYTLKTLPADDFPLIKTEAFSERFKVKDVNLKRLLERTSFAMAVHDVRFYLNGLLLEMSHNTLRAIASDGHRLAQSEEEITLAVDNVRQIIVPRKAVTEILRFLAQTDGTEVTCQVAKNHLHISWKESTLITLLIEGKFPEYKNVLDTEMAATLSVNRQSLLDVFARAAILTTDRFKGVRIRLAKGMMSVTTNNPDHETSVEEVNIEYDGEPIETGFNIDYLMDATRVVSEENAELNFQGSEGIVIFKQPKDEVTTWLVMPLRM